MAGMLLYCCTYVLLRLYCCRTAAVLNPTTAGFGGLLGAAALAIWTINPAYTSAVVSLAARKMKVSADCCYLEILDPLRLLVPSATAAQQSLRRCALHSLVLQILEALSPATATTVQAGSRILPAVACSVSIFEVTVTAVPSTVVEAAQPL
jgi:hypothetical protein